jgi:hypothetical protein
MYVACNVRQQYVLYHVKTKKMSRAETLGFFFKIKYIDFSMPTQLYGDETNPKCQRIHFRHYHASIEHLLLFPVNISHRDESADYFR